MMNARAIEAGRMSEMESWSEWYAQMMHRIQARRTARVQPTPGFVSEPEPRSIGDFGRGQQLVAGQLMFAGQLTEAKDAMIWELAPSNRAHVAQIHRFDWLDDLAAVGNAKAREVAQRWLWGWIERYGRGTGPGWTPDLTGRRLIRWLHHATFVLRLQPEGAKKVFFKSLSHQAEFLSKRGPVATPGLPRFEALAGLLYAGLGLTDMERFLPLAQAALSRECTAQIDRKGAITTRNPEELLEIFAHLTRTAEMLKAAGLKAAPAHLEAISRVAPTLRALRHSDGGLARFHGGERGLDGQLDQALSASEVRNSAEGLAMGYARLSASRTSVIVDAAVPPEGRASYNAHASTLAFEMTSGRRPLIVNCGAGAFFDEDWRRAGRATPSHSTLALEGYSSARLGREGRVAGAQREMLEDAPRNVPVKLRSSAVGQTMEAAHDGYVTTHGLTHARLLELAPDGRLLKGEDMLLAPDEPEKRRFDRVLEASETSSIPFHIRFHLHPDVEVNFDENESRVALGLKSGEVWIFERQGRVELSIEPSVYLEMGRLQPRATKQIVLTHQAMGYATRIRWSLAKAHDTAVAVRDLTRDNNYEFES